ncbi:carbon-nitrogen hydrolase [Halobacteriales archaeon QS_8_69_26]|nr:MAG: carbon-nitrogen hydrolase [Halobacteriales archaeon QS_8_69_26]
MRVALAQLEIEPGAVSENRDRAVAAVERAADRGAEFVVLPELFTVGYFAFDLYERHAEPLEGETVSRIRSVAEEHGVAVLAGSFVEDLGATEGAETPAPEGLANTSVLLDGEGRRRLVYRKRNLFGYGSAEDELLVPGERLRTAEVGGHTVGVTTCYDLRFPEEFRRLAAAGATMVAVPSAWPYPRVEHWQVLSRARAIENLFFLAAANGSASFPDATLLGRSAVYDPWGTPLASAGEDPALVTAEADPGRVAAVRGEFPAWHDRFGRKD